MVLHNFVCLHRLWEQLRLDFLLSALPIMGHIALQFNWTQYCCRMAVDELRLGELQLETPIKSILNDEEDVHLASRNVENVQNRVDKEE